MNNKKMLCTNLNFFIKTLIKLFQGKKNIKMMIIIEVQFKKKNDEFKAKKILSARSYGFMDIKK